MESTSVEQATVIARAWLDEEFKDLLESDPTAAFSQLYYAKRLSDIQAYFRVMKLV